MTEPTRPSGLETVTALLKYADMDAFRDKATFQCAAEQLTAALAESERLKAELEAEHETTRNDPAEQRVERYALEASDLTGRLIKAEAENERLRQELHEMRGTPEARFMWIIEQLEQRFPDPEPSSARAYEGRFLPWFDAMLAECAALRQELERVKAENDNLSATFRRTILD